MISLRVVVLLVGLVAAISAETDLEKRVTKEIEDFRTMMSTGLHNPKLEIPVLEPLDIDEIPISTKGSNINAKGKVSDITVPGMSGFKFTQISQKDSATLDLAVEVPDINARGHYDVQGKVKAGFINMKFGGDGPLQVSLKGLKGATSVKFEENNAGFLRLSSVDVKSWSFNKLSIKLDNLMGGGMVGKLVNTLVNKLIPTYLNGNRAKINNLIETFAPIYINIYLDAVHGQTVKSLHKHLMQTLSFQTEEEEESWVVTDEAQEILDQITLVLASAPAKNLAHRG